MTDAEHTDGLVSPAQTDTCDHQWVHLDQAHSDIWIDAQHHSRLSLLQDDLFVTGFDNGFAEALRIIKAVPGYRATPIAICVKCYAEKTYCPKCGEKL